MQLNFLTIMGKRLNVVVSPTQTISQIKAIVAKDNQIPNPENLEFIYDSKRLDNNTVASDLPVSTGSLILIHNTNQFVDVQKKEKETARESTLEKKRSYREFNEPPNFDQQIAQLVELGRSPQDCANALRNANYDLELAASMLIDF